MTLATDFLRHLAQLTRDYWSSTPNVKQLWQEDRAWTKLMLRDGLLVAAANHWAEPRFKGDYSQFWEEKRFDFMITAPKFSETAEGWRSRPVLTLEHEHRDDTYVECWGLAHWRSDLRVIVTYHANKQVLNDKLARAAVILEHVDQIRGTTTDEFLFVSMSREYSDEPTWVAHQWSSGWSKIGRDV